MKEQRTENRQDTQKEEPHGRTWLPDIKIILRLKQVRLHSIGMKRYRWTSPAEYRAQKQVSICIEMGLLFSSADIADAWGGGDIFSAYGYGENKLPICLKDKIETFTLQLLVY